MKTYKAVQTQKHNPDCMDLINVDDPKDFIFAAPDEFKDGELVTEDQIVLRKENYVTEEGVGSSLFAFKIS